jgi:hypothetical protein
MENIKDDGLNTEFNLIAKEIDKVSDVVCETLASLGMENITSIEVSKLPSVFAVLNRKLEKKNEGKDFTFAKVRVNPSNGHKLLSVNPEATDIKVGDWVCITKMNGINDSTNIVKLMEKLEAVENQPLIPPYDEQTKLKEMGVKMSKNGHYMSSNIKMKDLDKYVERVTNKLNEEEAKETIEFFAAKFKKTPIANIHSDSNISDEEINKIMGESN